MLSDIERLSRGRAGDAAALARAHDALLFLAAYPPDRETRARSESLLRGIGRRVRELSDVSPLLDPEISGIEGTWVEMVFSYDFVCWLAQRFPRQLEIDWEQQAPSETLAAVLAPFVPLLEEDASVDANVPWLTWLAPYVKAKDRGLAWLLRSIERLALPPEIRAALYDSLGLWIRWNLGRSPMTRTRMRRPPRAIFYQRTPPLSRREVSIERDLEGEPMPVSTLSRREGEKVLEMARAALAIRYRELYAFTYGDPRGILAADAGRGLEIFLIGIKPGKRLPLRAGFAPFLLRNGVPVGYADAFGLCERMEVSFNIFYAFRDGESAFCFSRMLELYHQLFGSTSFSIDPYQIGLGNDEAIDAGAFWFYRKLGFRSTDPRVERIACREEELIADDPGHRSSAATLRRLARSPMLFEFPRSPKSDWDRFHVRNIGLTLQGATPRIDRVARILGVETDELHRLGAVLSLIPDLHRWPGDDLDDLRGIVRAKGGRSEGNYLRLLTRHERLRRALLRLGSSRSRTSPRRADR